MNVILVGEVVYSGLLLTSHYPISVVMRLSTFNTSLEAFEYCSYHTSTTSCCCSKIHETPCRAMRGCFGRLVWTVTRGVLLVTSSGMIFSNSIQRVKGLRIEIHCYRFNQHMHIYWYHSI